MSDYIETASQRPWIGFVGIAEMIEPPEAIVRESHGYAITHPGRSVRLTMSFWTHTTTLAAALIRWRSAS